MEKRVLLPLLLVFVVQFGASSAGRVAVAPNQPGATAVVGPAQKEPSDPRLDVKITLKASRMRLPDVLAKVSKQSGVEIRVDQGSRFWAVRQRKVTLIVTDMPLRDLMAQLKLLLGYHISRTGKDSHYTYVVWQDMKGRKLEQGIVDAQLSSIVDARRRSVYDSLADARRVLEMTPDDIEWAKRTAPWLARLASDPHMLGYASLICAIPPRYFDRLLRDSYVFIDIDKLPPNARAAVEKIEALERPAAERNYARYGGFTVSAVSISPRGGILNASTATEYDVSVMAKPNDQSDPTYQHTVLPLGGFTMASSESESRLQCAALAKYVSGGKTEAEAQDEISRQVADGKRKGAECD